MADVSKEVAREVEKEVHEAGDYDWHHLKVDLNSKNTLHPPTLQAGSNVKCSVTSWKTTGCVSRSYTNLRRVENTNQCILLWWIAMLRNIVYDLLTHPVIIKKIYKKTCSLQQRVVLLIRNTNLNSSLNK